MKECPITKGVLENQCTDSSGYQKRPILDKLFNKTTMITGIAALFAVGLLAGKNNLDDINRNRKMLEDRIMNAQLIEQTASAGAGIDAYASCENVPESIVDFYRNAMVAKNEGKINGYKLLEGRTYKVPDFNGDGAVAAKCPK